MEITNEGIRPEFTPAHTKSEARKKNDFVIKGEIKAGDKAEQTSKTSVPSDAAKESSAKKDDLVVKGEVKAKAEETDSKKELDNFMKRNPARPAFSKEEK